MLESENHDSKYGGKAYTRVPNLVRRRNLQSTHSLPHNPARITTNQLLQQRIDIPDTRSSRGSPYSDRLNSDVRASQHQEIRISTGRRFLHHLNELPRIDSRAHRRVPRLGPKNLKTNLETLHPNKNVPKTQEKKT